MFLCEFDGYAPAGAGVRGTPKLTLAEFNTRFRAFLLDVYHRRENAETKMPPVERWEAKVESCHNPNADLQGLWAIPRVPQRVSLGIIQKPAAHPKAEKRSVGQYSPRETTRQNAGYCGEKNKQVQNRKLYH